MSCGQNGGSRPTKPGASYDGVHKSRWKTRHFPSDLGDLEGLLNSYYSVTLHEASGLPISRDFPGILIVLILKTSGMG